VTFPNAGAYAAISGHGRLCATEARGTYRFKASGRSITFTKVKDPCTTRGDILGKTWNK
jgi:hypothetical protein